MHNIMVSIICITYNHEKFIIDALNSFLMQKTSFKYEILVHDDASTDKTPEIIRRYETLFPNIIKPIYQKENQWSKNVPIIETFMIPRVKGKYIALCEGDDFWTDEKKLQSQVDFLETHPAYSLCCHSGYYVDEEGYSMSNMFRSFTEDKTVSSNELIRSWICPTSSLVFRSNFLKNSTFPELKDAPCGDYPLLINMSLIGPVYYIDRLMSVYRKHPFSVSVSWGRDSQKNIDVHKRFIAMLDEIDTYTLGIYSDDISVMRRKREFQIYLLNNQVDEAKKVFPDLWKKSRRSYYLLKLRARCPWLVRLNYLLRRIYRLHHKVNLQPKVAYIKEFG